MSRFLLVVFFITFTHAYESFQSEFQTIVLKANYFENNSVMVDANKEFIIRFPVSSSKYPYKVFAWSTEAYSDHPIFVVVRQHKSVTSWELPLLVDSGEGLLQFYSTSRTLCHNNMDTIALISKDITYSHTDWSKDIPGIHKELSMSVSTSSQIPAKVTVRVEEEDNFFVEDSRNYSVTVSPSQSRFFYYKFFEQDHENFTTTVILEVDSEDEVCLTVSVQNASCPVSDLSGAIPAYRGKFQTVSRKGGIIIKRNQFPKGFFIVFVASGDDFACSRESSVIPQTSEDLVMELNRSSTVSFSVKPSLSQEDYVLASLSTLGVILFFYLVFLFTTWAFFHWGFTKKTKQEDIILENITNETAVDSSKTSIVDAADDVDTKLASTNLMLSDLAKKKLDYTKKKSFAYLWHVVSIAIFYGIPVVQLVVTYQRVVNISGSQDICYYNFLCAHPLYNVSDFNHIYSNIGYGLVGILFLVITFYKQNFVPYNKTCGIPRNYGLFYAMGVSLIMEGVLSACYHVCPNQSNFQFDTSFMYVIATLCLVKLYENRHPDINATAYATFVVLGFAVFAVMVGILNGNIALWIIFIFSYMALCIYVSFNIYFLSYIRKGVLGVVQQWNEDRDVLKAIEPKRKAHFILLVTANIFNVLLACLGIVCYFMGTDFATFMLYLLLANTFLYAVVYMIMKMIHREKLCMQATLFGILGLVTWAAAMYFFVSVSTMWTVTAAESREWNTHCTLFDFYDHHDIWHLLSSAALFFSFMLLLSLDDDLVNTPQTKIAVF